MLDMNDLKRRMDASLDSLHKDFAGLRTGRASPDLLNGVMVSSYGSMTPLNAVASVNAPEARLLTVSVWDKGLVNAIANAIRDSGLGLNPSPDGQTIRVPLPALTEERRAELVKIAGKMAEESKIAIRNIRRDGMETIKAAKLPEDEAKRKEGDVQKLTDEYIKKIDEALVTKEKDIKTV